MADRRYTKQQRQDNIRIRRIEMEIVTAISDGEEFILIAKALANVQNWVLGELIKEEQQEMGEDGN